MARSAWLEVGVITRPHGLRGELKVHLHWRDSEALAQVDEVVLDTGSQRKTFSVIAARRAPTHSLLELEGVSDRNAAETWRGAKVEVAREALGTLEPGEYYLSDLMGAEVLGPDGPVGRVVGFACYPTVDAVVVECLDEVCREQPLLEPWLKTVDAEAGRIELSSLDGLL